MPIPTFTPTMLDTFERCPYQFRRKYVEKHKGSQIFSRDFACGSAAHAVLHGVMEFFRRNGNYPGNLRERAEGALPTSPYSDSAERAADVVRVVSWVNAALDGIPVDARVLQVERWLEYQYPGCAGCPAFLLRHRVDLVLEHDDGTLEHRDWKTGARTVVDDLQTVAARIVVRTAFPNHDRILSSTAFLAHGTVQIDELSLDEVRAVWQRIKGLAARAFAERDWQPVSNPLCPWCPLYQQGCPIYPAPVSGPDATTGWLEGAA